MTRRVVWLLLLASFALSSMGMNCGGSTGGGGGGGGTGGVGGAIDEIAQWIGLWSDDAARGSRRPPEFEIPPPPAVALPKVATQLGNAVRQSEPPLTALRARAWGEEMQTATEHTQSVLCEWFGWYVEDPTERPVQGSTEFFLRFVKSGLEVELNSPPSQDVEEAVELFRNAIAHGQSEAEDVRNASIAAACSTPLGS
jgi:hypothetical protein